MENSVKERRDARAQSAWKRAINTWDGLVEVRGFARAEEDQHLFITFPIMSIVFMVIH